MESFVAKVGGILRYFVFEAWRDFRAGVLGTAFLLLPLAAGTYYLGVNDEKRLSVFLMAFSVILVLIAWSRLAGFKPFLYTILGGLISLLGDLTALVTGIHSAQLTLPIIGGFLWASGAYQGVRARWLERGERKSALERRIALM